MLKSIPSPSRREDLRIGLRTEVSIVSVPQKNRCVIARSFIGSGDEIEACPIIRVPYHERPFLDKTEVGNYYFNLRVNSASAITSELDGCVVLGVASLCNHSDHPNANYILESRNTGYFFVLFAVEDIKNGDEICIKYKKKWFEALAPVSMP